MAAAMAFAVSLILHVSALTSIQTLPLLPSQVRPEIKRFTPVQMKDVRLDPPQREDTVDRQPLDAPAVSMPPGTTPDDVWTELKEKEPLLLPLPEPPAQPAVAETPPSAEMPPAIRQEVLAIPEQLFADNVSALPRRWIEKDIPKIDHAPDIQLPVEFGDLDLSSGSDSTFAGVSFSEDPSAGTPDWSAIMNRRRTGNAEGTVVRPSEQAHHGSDMFSEKPDDISSLRGIEDLLQVRVTGYQPAGSNQSLYFALHIERASEKALPVQPRDVLFIQDSSASMTPVKMDECRRGLKRWLDFLNPGDRFEIMGFRDDTYACFGGWKNYDADSRRAAMKFIDEMRAVGNTDVFRSLQSALTIEQDPARTMVLVLVTDARPTVGVTGSSDIIEGITRYNQGRFSVFAVGGGIKVNSFFLDLLSYRNRGEALVVKGEEEIPGAMETWAGQLRRPVLTDLSYSFSRIDNADIYPKQLTHLFLDRPLVIYGRLPPDSESFAFQVVGRAGGAWHDMVFVIDRDQISESSVDIRNQWAWQKVYHMIGDYLGNSSEEELERIRAFADEYKLIVPYGFSRALPRRDR